MVDWKNYDPKTGIGDPSTPLDAEILTAAFADERAAVSSTYLPAFIVDAAFGDGVTDATAHIQSKINAAGGGVAGNLGGKVVLPPGRYLLTAPLTWHVSNYSPTSQLAVPGPSIVGAGGLPGRIGDNIEDRAAVEFICKPGVFPTGQYVIDYTSGPGVRGAITGVLFENFGIQGNNLGAGIRLSTGRRCKIANVNTMNTAAPAPTAPSPRGGDDGAFTLTFNGDGASAAYNIIENCCAYSAGRDSFTINDGSNAKVIGCYSLNPARYGFYLGIMQTAIGCHNELSGVADFWMASTNTTVIGTEFYFRPHQSNVIISGWSDIAQGSAKLIGCSFLGCNDVSSPQTQAMVQVVNSGQPVNALFSGCTFWAGTTTSAFVHVVAGVTGNVSLSGCTFDGTPSVAPYVLNGFTGFTTDDQISTVGEVPIAAATALTATALGRMHALTCAAAYTLTLPTPVGAAGQQIGVRVTPASTNLVTLATAAGNIDGQATRIMWAAETATLQSDGTNWVKIAGKTIPMTCELIIAAVQSILNSAWTTVLLDTTVLDNTGLMSTLASNLITIRRPGRYSVTTQVGMVGAPAAATRTMVGGQKNATTTVVQNEINVVAGTFLTVPAQRDLTFAAADTMRLQFYQSTGSAWAIANGSAGNSPFLALREIPAW
jgi:hypothetical protein